MTRSAIALILGLFATFAVSGCAADKVDMANYSAVIDVRTAAEFAGGHLEGAMNLDIENGDLANGIAALDPAANYFVYCHSGRRAGLAVEYMKQHGFTGELLNAGGIDAAASSSGLAIVNN